MLEQFVVQLSSPADNDLHAIARFIIGNDEAEREYRTYLAEKVISGILKKTVILRTFPEGYSLVDDGESDKKYRKIHHKHYNIYFRVNNDTKTVTIIAIIDARRDPKYASLRLK